MKNTIILLCFTVLLGCDQDKKIKEDYDDLIKYKVKKVLDLILFPKLLIFLFYQSNKIL